MNYVLAVVTQFNSGLPEVMIKARGRAISKAVDVQQIVANKFISTLRNKEIKLSTESMLNEDGTRSRVSAIQITVTK
ncbi:MAG: DNA-binding protein Alba [Candidatus Marsarchaeota archaeon]|nr:DNA-binding protein Alba [Candidatus Marsarchaeota archaeon]